MAAKACEAEDAAAQVMAWREEEEGATARAAKAAKDGGTVDDGGATVSAPVGALVVTERTSAAPELQSVVTEPVVLDVSSDESPNPQDRGAIYSKAICSGKMPLLEAPEGSLALARLGVIPQA